MIKLVKLKPTINLDDYSAFAYLTAIVQDLRDTAESLLPGLRGRSVLMLNSTAQGGGVAEMLPRLTLMLNELGIAARWAVMQTERAEFFRLTKRLHNLIHGHGNPALGPEEKELYEDVSREVAGHLRRHLQRGDVLVVHDPQPLAVGAILKKQLSIHVLWRCHIGLDEHNEATRAAWAFLKPYAEACDHSVFSAPEYIPSFLSDRASIIHPGIDPLSHKNRNLTPHKLTGILCNSGLAKEHTPVLTPPFSQPARRLQPDGGFGHATQPDEIGFLYRPIVAQVSRWDRLKGFGPLLSGFARLKQRLREPGSSLSSRHRRRIEIARLVLAGPDPESVQDDPEAREVLDELREAYCGLDADSQKDIALLSLPMDSLKNNGLMVNAIQRCASIVVQNSLREGFGLTVTEAMWKGAPVLGSEACGLRQQIRDEIDGRLIKNPEDPGEIADLIDQMLSDDPERERYSRNAQKRAYTEFLVFTQVERWLRVLSDFTAQSEKKGTAKSSSSGSDGKRARSSRKGSRSSSSK